MSTLPRVAIVYDWVTTRQGGAERVLDSIHQAFPEAQLFTSVSNVSQAHWAKEWPLTNSFLQPWPFFNHHHRWTLPFLPLAFESLDLTNFDIVISVTSAFAKGVITTPKQLHVCYLLTPPRFLYSHRHDYFSPLAAWFAKPLLNYLQWWDQVAIWRPDKIIALSQSVSKRCQVTYQRQVDGVIYPAIVAKIPVETPTKTPTEPFFVVVSRLVEYKRIDLAILACQKLNYPLYVIGEGPEKTHLQNLVSESSNTHFLGHLSDGEVRWYLSHARALLMPGEEDFGLTALEAASTGTPTVLQASSGVAEMLQSDLKCALTNLSQSELETQLKELYQKPKVKAHLLPKYDTTTFAQNLRKKVFDWWSHQVGKGTYEYD